MTVRKRRRTGGKSKPKPEVRAFNRTALTDVFVKRFCTLIEVHGLPPDGCCDYLGLSPTVFHSYINRGRDYLDDPEQCPDQWAEFAAFYQRLRKATARHRLKCLRNLHRNAIGNGKGAWTAWMTILERRDRANFSKYDQGGGDAQQYQPDERFL